MTDQTVPNVTDDDRKLAREWAEFIEADVTGLSSRRKRSAARVILNAAPAPALPDGWRLADHKENGRVMVVRIDGENAIYATPYKATGIRTRICMTSDLEFADTPTGPNTLAVGTVIESADDPRIAALPVGSILLDRNEEATTKRSGEWVGIGYIPIPYEGDVFGPWKVLHIPKEEE